VELKDGSKTINLTFDSFAETSFHIESGTSSTLIYDPPATASSAAAAPAAAGSLSFATDAATDTPTDTVTPDGDGYVGSFSIAALNGSNGQILADWQFSLGNDQINLASGQTLTQSYNVDVNGLNETVSISIGGPGNDAFMFEPGIGADTILNFNAQNDIIDLENFSNIQSMQQLESLITTNAQGYAVIELGHGDSITIPGMTASYLEAHLASLVHLS